MTTKTTQTSRNTTAAVNAYSSYADGLTIMVMAKSQRDAVNRTAAKIAGLGIECDIEFLEDDVQGAYVDDDTTVERFLAINGVTLDADVMIVVDGDGIDGMVTSYTL